MPDIIFQELTPYIQGALGYIASAAISGVIGNRTDAWFTSLFYHQKKRLIDWINRWQPSIEDLQHLADNEGVRMLFSNAVSKITDEIDDKKLRIWPTITDAIVRRADIELDKKQLFVSLFNRLDAPSLQYLAALSANDGIVFTEIFPMTDALPMPETVNPVHNLGQLQCSTTGLIRMSQKQPTKFYLSQLGEEFIDFISENARTLLASLTAPAQ